MSLPLAAVLIATAMAAPQAVTEIQGTVAEAQPGRARLEISSDLRPAVGDPVTLGTDLDGLFVTLEETWKVAQTGDAIWVERVGEGPEAATGYKAVIRSEHPTRSATTSDGSRFTLLGRRPDEQLVDGFTVGDFRMMVKTAYNQTTSDFRNYYVMAAEMGYPQAIFQVGVTYDQGTNGAPVDQPTALSWFRVAAAFGHADAATFVGTYYTQAKGGVQQDWAEAMRWYERGIAAGNQYALANAAELYRIGGFGIQQSWERAQPLYQEAARRGNQVAQNYLRSIGSSW